MSEEMSEFQAIVVAKTFEQHSDVNQPAGHRRPGIPGTIVSLNERVQEIMATNASPSEKAHVAAALIESKVLEAYRLAG